MTATAGSSAAATGQGSAWEVFRFFLKLALTSFGGPIAHRGYFRDELVERRKWVSDKEYADLVALCQFLPGPAASQVAFGMGLHRASTLGALAAFLPSPCRRRPCWWHLPPAPPCSRNRSVWGSSPD